MKKLIPLLLMSVMVFILGSCTGNAEVEPDIPEDDTAVISDSAADEPEDSDNDALGVDETETDALSRYVGYDSASVPVLHYDDKVGYTQPYDGCLENVIFDAKEAGDCTVYLLGKYVMKTDLEGDDSIHSYYLEVAMKNAGGALSTCFVPSELEGVSQGGFNLYDDRMASYLTVYDMECPLIVLRYMTGDGSISGAFYTVKNGSLEAITGDRSAVGGYGSGFCTQLSDRLEADLAANTLIDTENGITYIFYFDNAHPNTYGDLHFAATFSDEVRGLANQIISKLEPDMILVRSILHLREMEGVEVIDGVDQNGNIIYLEIDDIGEHPFAPFLEPYDTVEKCMEIIHRVYTEEHSEYLYSKYIENSMLIQEVEGKLYAAMADYVDDWFDMPIQSAEKISDDVILAITTLTYHGNGESDIYEITLKNENGDWKVDKMIIVDYYGDDLPREEDC